jgi:SNF2 family DNA or RNA helicase
MKNNWPDVDVTVQKMLTSLIRSDAIEERMEQGHVEEGPDIRTKNKANQLKELLSSIPKDYSANKARNEKKELHEASKAFGHGKVKVINGKWLLKGMKTPLYHHQLLAADWMVGREISLDRPNGGMLADAMGLGKTVSTLATMVGNPPLEKEPAEVRKATLIVVPASLLSQWKAEIKEHVDDRIFQKVMSYKASADASVNILSDCDIVLTSYTEVMRSWPFPTTAEEKSDVKNSGIETWYSDHDSEKGDLHRVKWYRIVLDEAQITKNFKSRTSVACYKLNAIYRWALSGTPIQNNLTELFPYFRFLRMNWSGDFHTFKKNFGNPDATDSTQRLNVMLGVTMM